MKLTHKLLVAYFRSRLNVIAFFSKRKAAESAWKIFCTPIRKPKRRTPAIFKTAEPLSFSVDDHTIRGYRWNHPKAKKILIVHGFESASRNFDRYITQLIKKDYETLAFDAPAHGLSSGKQINLPLYLATIRKAYELYGPIDGFIAHSYGGLIVAHFLESITHEHPIKAVLIAPATETTSTIDSFFRFLRLDDDVRKEFDLLIYTRSGSWPAHFSVRRAMHHIRAEILWFHDEDDDLTPVEDALRVRDDQHPHVRFRITKGLGHRMIYRDDAVLKEIVEFL